MKLILRKIGGFISVICLLGFIVGVIGMFEESGINDEIISIDFSEVGNPENNNKWVATQTSYPDLDNSYEYVTENEKTGIEISVEYYVPMLGLDAEVSYLLQTKAEDVYPDQAIEGLIVPYSEIDSELRAALAQDFPGQTYAMLDSTYKHKSTSSNIGTLIILLLLSAFGAFLVKLGRPKQEA